MRSSQFKLGMWCAVRREDHRNSRLSKERIDELNDLGFIWDPVEYNEKTLFKCCW